MRVTVKKWGNSASVRIPAAIMEAAKLQIDATVDIREENGCIVIEPIPAPNSELEALVSAITRANLHDEFDFGPAQGKEAL